MKRSRRKPNFKELIAKHGYNTKWYNLSLALDWVLIKEDKNSLRKWMSKKRKKNKKLRIISRCK